MSRFFSIFLILVFGSTQAAVVTVNGTDVSFTYDDATLFGSGTVVGNTIIFSPADYLAESLNTEGLETVTDTLDIAIEVTTQYMALFAFVFEEQGDYRLDGAFAAVSAGGTLTVTSDTGPFSDSEGFSAGPLIAAGALTDWSAGASIDLDDTLDWGSDTAVTMSITNALTADSSILGERALVQKKFVGVGLTLELVQPSAELVPVPPAVWLFGSALGLLACLRRVFA